MESISSLLRTRIKDPHIYKNLQIAKTLRCFDELMEEIFDKKIASYIKSVFLKDRVLGVAVKSSVISQELKIIEDDLIKAVNNKVGRDVVGGIMYIIK